MGRSFFKYTLLLFDMLAIVLSFRIAYGLRYESGLSFAGAQIPFSAYWEGIALAIGIWIILFYWMKLDEPSLPAHFSFDLSILALACVCVYISILSGSYLAQIYYSRLLLALFSVLLFPLLLCLRLLHKGFVRIVTKNGIGRWGVAIVGRSEIAREIAKRLAGRRDLGYELVGFVFPALAQAEGVTGIETFKDAEQLACQLKQKGVDELIFAMPIRRDSEMLEFIAACQRCDMRTKFVPEHYDLHTSVVKNFNIDGIPLFEMREAGGGFSVRVVKTALDCVLGILFGVLMLPLIVAITIVLLAAKRGKAVHREIRVGLGGRPFVMYRFNVGGDGQATAAKADWSGRFREALVRYSLSELPQLWNVLKGDMSIVGPRPETSDRVQHYSAWHRRRLYFKPGITGLAQVKGLRGVASSDEKTRYDLEYEANYTPLMDLGLIAATLSTLIKRKRVSKSAEQVPSVAGSQERDLRQVVQEKVVKS